MPAGITDKLRKYKSLFSTTLSTSIGTGTSDTITPASVTGLPTDTAITLTFDRVDSGGVATPTKLERIRGIISGGNFTAYVRGKDGTTEQAHTAGAVIEMIWNADDLNDMVDHGLVQHNQDGTHKAALVTTLKATAAEVATGTDDTKIVTPKALADATVGKLGAAWTAYTPNWTNLIVGSATNTGRYCVIGKTVFLKIRLTFAADTSVSGMPAFSIPYNFQAGDYRTIAGFGTAFDASAGVIFRVNARADGGSAVSVTTENATGTYVYSTDTSSTIPFTWTTSDILDLNLTYEMA